MSPFQALYGRPVPDANRYIAGTSDTASIDATMMEHDRLRKLLTTNLKHAQQRMLSLTKAQRLDKEFQLGDMAFLRLHDYRQTSVANRQSKKLSRRFYGPFWVVERIGAVAYKLDLPADARIHLVFHVSLLKQAFGSPPVVPLPQIESNGDDVWIPESILDHHWNASKIQVLVTWQNRLMEEATWEHIDELLTHFPAFTPAIDYVS
ncbi:uncharacterized protein LOC110943173 [Helianthus annuus]|uniref:uncharacterized protein LOC110943173 n=1 Tax=Helianthus annuus TaxID=4232 RepID=UPI000B8F2C67|nr:uncharacterized protein LOC110943173 [Helianthus annuus]